MTTALIGHTGFVGSNLAAQERFKDFFNSKNIESIMGKTYELVVCAGAPAEKWKANAEPEKDLENIDRLINCLNQAQAKKFILISTIDVYPAPIRGDEDAAFDPSMATPYGRHRLRLEEFVERRFDSLTIRLPGLFGPGLKKNAVYDFIHHNNVDQIHADSVFQFYHTVDLWRDIQIALKHDLKRVNFATEPLSGREMAREVFGLEFSNQPATPPAYYDFRTKYCHLFGGAEGYLRTKRQVLAALRGFVKGQRMNSR